MIAPDSIHIWEQHAGRPPVCHASTDSPEAVDAAMRAWLSQFADRCVALRWRGDDVLVCSMELTGSAFEGRPIATLWVEHPDELLARMVPEGLDARWRAGGGGASLDTRDGVRRRVSR